MKPLRRTRCKCQITGEEGWNDEFYRVHKNGRNYYYKTKELYVDYKTEMHFRSKSLSLMHTDILGLGRASLPSLAYRHLSEWNEAYSYAEIYFTLKELLPTFDYYNKNKRFKDLTLKMLYYHQIFLGKAPSLVSKYRESMKVEKAPQPREEDVIGELEDKTSETKIDISKFLD